MAAKRSTIAETLRGAIRRSGKSFKRIATDTGVERMSISRFMQDEKATIRLDKADILAEYFEIEVRETVETNEDDSQGPKVEHFMLESHLQPQLPDTELGLDISVIGRASNSHELAVGLGYCFGEQWHYPLAKVCGWINDIGFETTMTILYRSMENGHSAERIYGFLESTARSTIGS